jgi:hypothetical protein
MQGNLFPIAFHHIGNMAANLVGEIKLPFPCSLVAVSLSNSANSNGLLDLGTSADADGIANDLAVGNDVQTVFTPSSFNGALAVAGNPYHLEKDEIFTYTLDFDGAAGTAAANVTLVLWFMEG